MQALLSYCCLVRFVICHRSSCFRSRNTAPKILRVHNLKSSSDLTADTCSVATLVLSRRSLAVNKLVSNLTENTRFNRYGCSDYVTGVSSEHHPHRRACQWQGMFPSCLSVGPSVLESSERCKSHRTTFLLPPAARAICTRLFEPGQG